MSPECTGLFISLQLLNCMDALLFEEMSGLSPNCGRQSL